MFELLRPLYEHWLLQASQGPLPAWQRALLLRALQRDEALRCLALELADFGHGAGGSVQAPDLRPSLKAQALVDLVVEEEPPLFPAAWVPAAALAVILLVALVVLWQPAPEPLKATASMDRLALLAEPTSTPTVTVPKAEEKP